jgi:hypothetical protein
MAISDNPAPPPTPGVLARFSVRPVSPAALYDDWLIAETEATLALAAWRAARPAAKPWAHASYLAALDREQDAALMLEDRLNPH